MSPPLIPPHNGGVASIAKISVHPSQFPENVRRDLIESLRRRQVNPKFHYDSLKQTRKWLALHQAYSPSRTDAGCAAIYDRSFAAAAQSVQSRRARLIGLGCGGGQKDTRLLRRLRAAGKEVFYTPSDVSAAMVLEARQAALSVVAEENCFPLVCDLATAGDLPGVLDEQPAPEAARLITFFGMIPNFEPEVILPRLAGLLRPEDTLLFSANLAPGTDYEAGVRRILPLYDNALTRDWLMTFLLDLGVEREDGRLEIGVEAGPAGSGLRRVAAWFHFSRPCSIQVDDQTFAFKPEEAIRLFYSYRHTPALARTLLEQHGLEVVDQWIAPSEEEGVFLARRVGKPV